MKNNYIVNLFNKNNQLSKKLTRLNYFCQKQNCRAFEFKKDIFCPLPFFQKIIYGCICNYFVFLLSTSAIAFTLDTPIVEGAFIRGTLNENEKLFLGQTEILPSSSGQYYFGLPQDAVSPLVLTLKTSDTTRDISYPIEKRKWDEQRINGLPNSKVNINSANQKRIANENKQLRLERAKTITDFFPTCFVRPVKEPYRISGSFGNRRIFNNQVPAGHSGTDYAAPKGTPVYAIADGIIVITHPDMFLSGKTVLVNHGHGIFAAYSHLNNIDVKTGTVVKQGDVIGKIGATGRATGPHLHFTMTWYTTRVDPEQVFTYFICK